MISDIIYHFYPDAVGFSKTYLKDMYIIWYQPYEKKSKIEESTSWQKTRYKSDSSYLVFFDSKIDNIHHLNRLININRLKNEYRQEVLEKDTTTAS